MTIKLLQRQRRACADLRVRSGASAQSAAARAAPRRADWQCEQRLVTADTGGVQANAQRKTKAVNARPPSTQARSARESTHTRRHLHKRGRRAFTKQATGSGAQEAQEAQARHTMTWTHHRTAHGELVSPQTDSECASPRRLHVPRPRTHAEVSTKSSNPPVHAISLGFLFHFNSPTMTDEGSLRGGVLACSVRHAAC